VSLACLWECSGAPRDHEGATSNAPRTYRQSEHCQPYRVRDREKSGKATVVANSRCRLGRCAPSSSAKNLARERHPTVIRTGLGTVEILHERVFTNAGVPLVRPPLELTFPRRPRRWQFPLPISAPVQATVTW
jgi:hypothetical protein